MHQCKCALHVQGMGRKLSLFLHARILCILQGVNLRTFVGAELAKLVEVYIEIAELALILTSLSI